MHRHRPCGGWRLGTMQRIVFKVTVQPGAGAGGISPDQADAAAGPMQVPQQRPAASRSWTEAAVILRRGILVGLRRVLACSCADCRDAAAHRAE